MSSEVMLSGSEYVLVAQVPKGSDRWEQTHFNRDIVEQFFRLSPGDSKSITLERIDYLGQFAGRTSRTLVFSDVNKNPKIELDYSPICDYPVAGVPILLVLELDPRTFRYRALMPGGSGYAEMLQLSNDLPKIGRGHRRGITNLDEVELRWPGAGLRS